MIGDNKKKRTNALHIIENEYKAGEITQEFMIKVLQKKNYDLIEENEELKQKNEDLIIWREEHEGSLFSKYAPQMF